MHLAGDGVDVAVLASHASAVELCLLDPDPNAADGWSERRVSLGGPTYGVWHAHVPGVLPGQHYGFRAHGSWDPGAGTRYNPAKLLVDPYARGLAGIERLGMPSPLAYGQRVDAEHRPLDGRPVDSRDSRAHVPHSVVLAESRPAPDTRPRTPWAGTVVYEAHVRGLTRRLRALPAELRGTYAGLGHPATIEHLRSLGVTAIELLPVHAMVTEPWLALHGRSNYWGYNTLGFFAPHPGYATHAAQELGPDAVLAELKEAVQALHAAGIEVLLDVVYNHTAEGGTDGLHLSWRGLDPTVYYLHDGGTPARFADVTGCGNSLDFRRPRVVQLALDSLRYWATEVGVDGFRFDLMVTLARDDDGFDPQHPFLVALQTDPVLTGLKLIAEPWDVGPGGWRTGAFPAPIAEWNDRFRNAARSFWLQDPAEAAHGRLGHGVRELATRLAGSADLFGYSDPPAHARTRREHQLRDRPRRLHPRRPRRLRPQAQRRQRRAEPRRDRRQPLVEPRDRGPGARPGGRAGDRPAPPPQSMRNLLATLLLSAGVPMITAGDEIGRTQQGNNNAYNQDNEISWIDWELSPWRENLLATARHLLRLRRELPALQRRDSSSAACRGPTARTLAPTCTGAARTAHPLATHEWNDPHVRTIQMIRTSCDGSAVLVLINGALDPVAVTLADGAPAWHLRWDSTVEHPDDLERPDGPAANGNGLARSGASVLVEALSIRVYSAPATPEPDPAE